MVDGILVVNKPSGVTSRDIVNQACKILATKKINARLSNTIISIVDENRVEKFISNVEKEYRAATGSSIRFYTEKMRED